MAATISYTDGLVQFFESLEFPIPVYSPVEGELRNNIEFAVEQLKHFDGRRDTDLHLKFAYALLCLDRKDEAAEVFEQVKNTTDTNRVRLICYIERGIILGEKRELEAGLQLLKKHPDIFEDDEYFRCHIVERGKYELGILLFEEKDFSNAAGYLESGLSYRKDDYEVHRCLGISYTRMKEFSKAQDHLNICINLNPDEDSDVSHCFGNIYFSCSRYQEAVQAYVRSATIANKLGDKFYAECYKWWLGGAIAAKHCEDYEQGAKYLTLSLKAALKIPEHGPQARMLNAASSWLYICIQAKVLGKHLGGESLQDKNLVDTPLQESGEEHLKTLKAEGYGTLGIAMVTYQAYDEAQELLQRAISMLRENSELDSWEKLLLFRFYWAEATVHSALNETQKALDAFQNCKSMASNEADRLRSDIKSSSVLKRMGRFLTAAKMFGELEVKCSALLDTEVDLKAELLLGLGQSLLGIGKATEGVERLDAARGLLEDNGLYTSDLLPVTYSSMYVGLIEQGLFFRALELVSSFQAAVREHHAGSKYEQIQHVFTACASRLLSDNEASRATLTELMELQDIQDWKIKAAACSGLANVYKNQRDYDAAEAKYSETIRTLQPGEPLLESQVYISRAGLYLSKAAEAKLDEEEELEMNKRALNDYDHAIEILEESKVLPHDLASAYTGQAVVLFHMKEHKAAGEKLDRAMEMAGDNKLLRAKMKRVRATLLFAQADQFKQAMAEAREAALLFAEIQLQLQDLESAWVTLLEGDMKHLFFMVQEEWGHRNPMKALLWAERSRLRLYFHLADQSFISGGFLEPLAFDRDDDHAHSIIASAVECCGQGCAFVEYSFSPAEELLYIYVVRHDRELKVDFKEIRLEEILMENEAHPRSIDALVRRTRTQIKRKDENKAKVGLGALYRLLVKPVWELLEGYETIIFAPAGSVWLVPFAALYDESCSKFLIEKKRIGIVPSLRALRRCQLRYEEAQSFASTSSFGFVAGDPEPMGLNCGQLPGARQEAIEVAELLGVDPLIGREMTKQAVIGGLKSQSRVISLVTHGVVDAIYPHGALVMQGKREEKMIDVERLVLLNSFVPKRSSSSVPKSESSEVLTASEITKLDTHAALVVLSACQTGEGEFPSEGLLGLARAVLQAGSSCTVVTLWKVDDDATKQLMIGMFRELMSNKHTVVEALRWSMLKLLKTGAPVYMWASAAALGFSLIRISSGPDVSAEELMQGPVQGEQNSQSFDMAAKLIPNTTLTSPPRVKNKRRFMCCWKF